MGCLVSSGTHRRDAAAQRNLIVLDGLVTAADASPSPQDLKVFVGQVQAISALAGCDTLLLNSSEP